MPAPADQALPGVLRRLRETRGFSQEATAQAAGISLNTYSRIERGYTTPLWTTVIQLADALEVSIVELAEAVEAER
jgi:transcriptional regulator with XRE-family HTH domain